MTDTAVAPPADTTAENAKPIWTRARQGIVVSIFPNQNDDGRNWYSISSRKRYKDDSDNWHTSSSFTVTEILIKSQLEQMAVAEIVRLEGAQD